MYTLVRVLSSVKLHGSMRGIAVQLVPMKITDKIFGKNRLIDNKYP